MGKHTKMCMIAVAIRLSMLFVLAAALPATSSAVCSAEKLIASKIMKDVVIVLTNEQGRLTSSENTFCVTFRKVATGELVDVQSVSLDFSLLVGKIQEEPVIADLTREAAGQYSGRINLGRLYYHPASYYAFVRYQGLDGKKRKVRFFLSVK